MPDRCVDDGSALPSLVLTGGPAVGKSTTGRALAATLPRAAFIEVDDVRRLVVSGAAAPWEGAEGSEQQRLGVRNACALARNFRASGFGVVLADVLTPETAELYRALLPESLVVHLQIGWTEAERREATRRRWLTDAEFRALHRAQREAPPPSDHRVDVTALTAAEQAERIAELWHGARRQRAVGPA